MYVLLVLDVLIVHFVRLNAHIWMPALDGECCSAKSNACGSYTLCTSQHIMQYSMPSHIPHLRVLSPLQAQTQMVAQNRERTPC